MIVITVAHARLSSTIALPDVNQQEVLVHWQKGFTELLDTADGVTDDYTT